MKVKVSPSRLLSLLQRDGFILGPELSGQDEFSFVREAKTPELFEWVIVGASGKRSEAVYASYQGAPDPQGVRARRPPVRDCGG